MIIYSDNPELQLVFIKGNAWIKGVKYSRFMSEDDAEFEAKVKRDDDGKFATQGGSGSNSSEHENKVLESSKITPKEFDNLALKSAEPLRLVEYSPEAFEKDFPGGKVKTPINEVKIGENQMTKLFSKHRDSRFGLIKPTFERPTVIFREYDSPEKIEEYKSAGKAVLRDYRYCYVKAFKSSNGKKYFCNVSVLQDGGIEVSITSRDLRRNQVLNKMGLHEVVWKHGDGRASS